MLAVLATLMVIVLPRLRMGEDAAHSEARKVASLLRETADEAVMRKETLTLRFDLKDKTITLKRPASGDTKPEGKETLVAVDTLKSVELPSRGEVKEGALSVQIGPMGAGEHIIVHLKSDAELLVTLNSISGRVKVRELP